MRIRIGNTDELIILRNAFGAGEGAGLYLARAETDSEVSNTSILGLA